MSKSWASGSTRAWRKVRARVLARDGYRCRLQLPGVCTGRASHVHHLHGKARGDDPAYLVAACAACNLKVGDPTKAPDPPCRPVTRW
jgi:5-methylcytosine-specific restriction endonuclease McrA